MKRKDLKAGEWHEVEVPDSPDTFDGVYLAGPNVPGDAHYWDMAWVLGEYTGCQRHMNANVRTIDPPTWFSEVWVRRDAKQKRKRTGDVRLIYEGECVGVLRTIAKKGGGDE